MNSPYVDPELVIVFECNEELEALVVRGLLTSAGIDSVIMSLEMAHVSGGGTVVVKVNAAQADEARQIIAESTQVFTDDGEEIPENAENGGE